MVCTHTLGQGMPDLIVDYRGHTCLIEIKDGAKIPSKRRLTPQQEEFHAAWTGEIYVVETVEEALAAATGEKEKAL